MSQENVELVASVYDAGRDYTAFYDPAATEAVFEGFREFYAPAFEFHAVTPEGSRLVERGIDGYLNFMRDWLAAWKSYSIAAEGLRDLGDRVAVLTRHHGRLKDGGSEVRSQGVDLWTLRDGLFVRLEAYLDRAAGLEAVGLRE